ncbi:S8 family serine peptidase [Bacteriovorax sp. PP10]|uniref:S8 family serine peptidase n=1 Tax=Bacteriovorax antarcticus TaxID=3088717 RepID=A0ABU5VY46_9BACT|nr:S8 family serine peptidase [Bacteriovorax sp. PP10]MEA9356930.1 S8 family serine peptidase [Bacteriovorax sp. PP10]
MKTNTMKMMIRRLVVLNVLATISFASFAQSNIQGTLPRVVQTQKVEEKSYFDPKDLTSNYVSWGINPENPSSINLLEAWKHYKKKRDIVVAVVDTGIDPVHPFLEKNIFVEQGRVDETNFGVDFSKDKKGRGAPLDQHGHGTHVSGIIKSIYPEVKILALKYYNPTASGIDNLNSTVEALRYAVDNNVDVINYSGGGPEAAVEELRILKEAERKGILVVAAAGNEESNIDDKKKAYFPASYGLKNIITVTAHDEDLKILSSSNYGRASVDIFAPGYRIKSSLQNGRAGYLTGTSQATAFVTGVAALIKSQFPGLSTEKIKEIIKASAKKEITMEGKCATGGRLDAASALALASQYAGESEMPNRQLATKKEEGKIIYRLAN